MANRTEYEAMSYLVVFNLEEQFSIWPTEKQIPLGWSPAGKRGSKDECLAYINTVWTDMRPLSLRKRMEKAGFMRQSFNDQNRSLEHYA